MDPNANLDQQLDITKRILSLVDSGDIHKLDADTIAGLAEELAEHVDALDHWITGGGALPERWKGR